MFSGARGPRLPHLPEKMQRHVPTLLVETDPAEVSSGRQSLIQPFYSILEHHHHFHVGQPALASGCDQLVNSFGEHFCGHDDLLCKYIIHRRPVADP